MTPVQTAAVAETGSDVADLMLGIGRAARAAGHTLAETSTDAKNKALIVAAAAILRRKSDILAANAKDMAAAERKGLTKAVLDRLMLDEKRVEAMAKGIEDVRALADPIGTVIAAWDRPNGLHIERVRVPLGVIGIIYESRPNVTADAGALCLKAGNACILRGGSESFHSSAAIVDCLHEGLRAAGIPETAIQRVPTTDRAAVGERLKMVGLIDVIVPRGGKSLIERITADSKVPLFILLEGLCHTYVDAKADLEKALAVTLNAKMRRTGVCGATETLLVERKIAGAFLPDAIDALIRAGCEVRGDADTKKIDSRVVAATAADWDTEYLDAIIAVAVVDGLDGAIDHIARHGSGHTDAILTEDKAAAETFVRRVDSAIVLVNASTQFADGGEFGMGAEIGISTGRLHARGPVGVEQLTSFKYVVRGAGQCRP